MGQQDDCKSTYGNRIGSYFLLLSFDRRLLWMLALNLLFANTWRHGTVWAATKRTGKLLHLCVLLKILIGTHLLPQSEYTHTESWIWSVFSFSSYCVHPKLPSKPSLIIPMLYVQRKHVSGTQGQSSHFHSEWSRTAFPGHSFVTPVASVRLS